MEITEKPSPRTGFELIERIKKLDKNDQDYSRQRDILTDNIPDILSKSSDLSVQEKVELVSDIVRLGRWDYEFMARGDGQEIQKTRALKNREVLDEYLTNNIPPSKLSEDQIAILFDAKDDAKGGLIVLENFIAVAVSDQPIDIAKKFINRFNTFNRITPEMKTESDLATAISKWPPNEAMPYVINIIEENKGKSELLKVIPTIIEKWPPENQIDIVSDVLISSGLDGIYTDKIFKIVSNWGFEQSEPLLKQLVTRDERRHGTYWERDFGSMARAMSNWSSNQINDFLSSSTINQSLDRFSEGNLDKRQYMINVLKVHTLADRKSDFDFEMIGWLKENIKLNIGKQSIFASEIVKHHSELFTPDVASMLILSKSDSSVRLAMDMLIAMPHDVQLTYKSSLVDMFTAYEENPLFRNQMRSKSDLSVDHVVHFVFKDITDKWTKEEIEGLATELLSRPLEDKSPYRRSGGKSANILNAFYLLNTQNEISNHDHIKKILLRSMYQPESEEGKLATELFSKIVKDKVTEEILVDVAGDVISLKFSNFSSESFIRIKEIYSIYGFNELDTIYQKLPIYVQSMITSSGITDTYKFLEFIDNNFDYFKRLSKTPDKPSLLDRDDISILSDVHLSLWDAEIVKRAGINLKDIKSNDDYIDVFRALEGSEDWGDQEVILQPFEEGANIFGFKKMFEYVNKEGVSRHDALHAFKDIIYLQSVSGLTPDQFFNQVLAQVLKDDANYDTGTAHHELNSIAQTLDTHFEDNAKLAEVYKDIEGLGELAEQFKNPEQVFESWKRLKRYSKLTQLLGEREVLEQLQQIDNPKLKQYVTRLAFHKDSKVDMKAAIEFAIDPEAFLARDDGHAPREVHDRKKPSNYTDINNLGLTAKELVEALVEGKMDGLSVFTPMEVRYIILASDEELDSRQLLKRALGQQQKEGIPAVQGEATNTRKLFFEVNKILKQEALTVQEYLLGSDISTERRTQVEALINGHVFNNQYGIRGSSVKTQTFVAKIGRKSDPEMVLAGDDTVNCMPFGSGKNTVYTFNPNTAQFVVQVENNEGKRRTIAQSVLTKDLDIKMLIPDVIAEMQNENGHLSSVLPEDNLLRQSAIIACDNVEVSPNFTGQKDTITAIYRDFFREYLQKFSKEQNLQATKVIVGEGYSDALDELPAIPNTYAPQAPVSYSDKTNDEVRVLEMDKQDRILILGKDITVDEVEKPKQEKLSIQGLESLTFEDALQVSYIEGKAYADNQSLIQYLHNMENGLIAKDISNASKGKPNMSLSYRDSAGKMQGYLFAYEGVLDDNVVLETHEEYTDTPFVYVSDIASDISDKGSNETGLALLRGFVELYKQNYVDKDNLIPIFAQMRENTSYKIIKKGLLNRLVRDLGIQFEIEELESYEVGDSTMHPVIIKPVKIQ